MFEVAIYEFGCKLFTFKTYDDAIHFAQYAAKAEGVRCIVVCQLNERGATESIMWSWNRRD